MVTLDSDTKWTIGLTYLTSLYILCYVYFAGHFLERAGLEFVAFLTILLVIVLMFYAFIAIWSVFFILVKLRALKALAFAPLVMVLVTVFCVAVRFEGAGMFWPD
jgi:hypothetical protein